MNKVYNRKMKFFSVFRFRKMSSIEIKLPHKHICGEYCANTYIFGWIPTGLNPSYKDGKCNESDMINDHRSPRIERIGEDMWEKEGFLQPDEIVITDSEITLKVDYPLSGEFDFVLKSAIGNGFTRKELVSKIKDTYEKIYKSESDLIMQPGHTREIPLEERIRLMNRNQTDGKYGIWGHDLGDLWLEGINYTPGDKVLRLSIGS